MRIWTMWGPVLNKRWGVRSVLSSGECCDVQPPIKVSYFLVPWPQLSNSKVNGVVLQVTATPPSRISKVSSSSFCVSWLLLFFCLLHFSPKHLYIYIYSFSIELFIVIKLSPFKNHHHTTATQFPSCFFTGVTQWVFHGFLCLWISN